jgi:hypothetical protein
MSRVHVDVVVVGGELCGLAAGALLALAGKTVLVVDDHDEVARPLGDRQVPVAPSFWKLPASGPAAGLFDALAQKADARRLLGEPYGVGVVDDPDLRCVLPAAPDALAREMARAFGDVTAKAIVRAFDDVDVERRSPLLTELAHLHEDGWFFQARRAAGRVRALGAVADVDVDATIAGLGAGPLAPVLAQLAPFVQSRADASAAGLAGLWAAAAVDGGASPGGALGPRAVLRELLLSFIAKHKGEVRSGRVARIEVTGKKVSLLGVEHATKGHSEVVASAVVDATSRRDFVDRLPASRARDKMLAQQGRVVRAAHATSVRWLVPMRVLPRGLPPLLLKLEAQAAPFLCGLYMGLPLGDRSHVDEQLIAVVASAFDADAEGLRARLAQLLPFAESAVRHHDVVDASAVFTHYRVVASEHALGGRRPRTALKNVVRAGRDLAPVFGVDGELVAARAVVALVERQLPRVAP